MCLRSASVLVVAQTAVSSAKSISSNIFFFNFCFCVEPSKIEDITIISELKFNALFIKPYIVETTAESNLETSFPKSLKCFQEGSKQGCPAACILFNIFFAIVIGVIKQQLYTQGIELKFR